MMAIPDMEILAVCLFAVCFSVFSVCMQEVGSEERGSVWGLRVVKSEAHPIHLFRHLCCSMYCQPQCSASQTERQHNDDNSWAYCVQYNWHTPTSHRNRPSTLPAASDWNCDLTALYKSIIYYYYYYYYYYYCPVAYNLLLIVLTQTDCQAELTLVAGYTVLSTNPAVDGLVPAENHYIAKLSISATQQNNSQQDLDWHLPDTLSTYVPVHHAISTADLRSD